MTTKRDQLSPNERRPGQPWAIIPRDSLHTSVSSRTQVRKHGTGIPTTQVTCVRAWLVRKGTEIGRDSMLSHSHAMRYRRENMRLSHRLFSLQYTMLKMGWLWICETHFCFYAVNRYHFGELSELCTFWLPIIVLHYRIRATFDNFLCWRQVDGRWTTTCYFGRSWVTSPHTRYWCPMGNLYHNKVWKRFRIWGHKGQIFTKSKTFSCDIAS